MKTALRILVAMAISLGALTAHAQRAFDQGELDAVLAPIALYPDPLVTHILNASVFPQDVAAAAAWSRANPQLQGDAALAAVEGTMWHPSVKALVAYPEVLSRMAESPQWLGDLGEAYSGSPDAVNGEIQQLRARAQANGNLQSNEQQSVYQQGQDIVVQPVYPQVMYVPYYNPYIVYGTWWWPAYRPVYWRPWVWHPVVVTRVVAPVRIVRPAHFSRSVQVTPYHRVPESQRMPIIHSGPTFQQPVQSAPQSTWHHMPVAPAAPRAQVVAPRTQTAPRASPMPAPQVRFAEPRFNRGYQAAAGAGFRGGNGGGAMRGGGGGNGGQRGGGRHKG